jgi:NADPH-dependent curcumin reductase CurA
MMCGCIVTDFAPRFAESGGAMPGWMMAGTSKMRQDIRPGHENAAATVNGLSTGGKLGKLLVAVTP